MDCACSGNARHRLQGKPLVSDPAMHNGTCVMHVDWILAYGFILTCMLDTFVKLPLGLKPGMHLKRIFKCNISQILIYRHTGLICVTSNFYLIHDLDLVFSRSNFEMTVCQELEGVFTWSKRDASRYYVGPYVTLIYDVDLGFSRSN